MWFTIIFVDDLRPVDSVDFAEKHSEKAPRDKVCHLCYFEVHVLVLTLFGEAG